MYLLQYIWQNGSHWSHMVDPWEAFFIGWLIKYGQYRFINWGQLRCMSVNLFICNTYVSFPNFELIKLSLGKIKRQIQVILGVVEVLMKVLTKKGLLQICFVVDISIMHVLCYIHL